MSLKEIIDFIKNPEEVLNSYSFNILELWDDYKYGLEHDRVKELPSFKFENFRMTF